MCYCSSCLCFGSDTGSFTLLVVLLYVFRDFPPGFRRRSTSFSQSRRVAIT